MVKNTFSFLAIFALSLTPGPMAGAAFSPSEVYQNMVVNTTLGFRQLSYTVPDGYVLEEGSATSSENSLVKLVFNESVIRTIFESKDSTPTVAEVPFLDSHVFVNPESKRVIIGVELGLALRQPLSSHSLPELNELIRAVDRYLNQQFRGAGGQVSIRNVKWQRCMGLRFEAVGVNADERPLSIGGYFIFGKLNEAVMVLCMADGSGELGPIFDADVLKDSIKLR
jgi:hypothetical protein